MVSRSFWVLLTVWIAMLGVLIHVGALWGGPAWFEFFGAPPVVVASARAGTWLAPIGALTIAAAMGACGYYAASALGWVRRPPLQRLGLAVMAGVCLVRALMLPLLLPAYPALLTRFEVVAALVWALAGVGLVIAWRATAGAAPSPLR